jgi:hypothetical protein
MEGFGVGLPCAKTEKINKKMNALKAIEVIELILLSIESILFMN